MPFLHELQPLGGEVDDARDEVREAIASVQPNALTSRLRQLGVDVRPEMAQVNCPF